MILEIISIYNKYIKKLKIKNNKSRKRSWESIYDEIEELNYDLCTLEYYVENLGINDD